MKFRRTLLSLCIASAITSCGGGSGKKTLTPTEKKSLVCLDSNKNAKCDTGETSEKVGTWDKENPVKTTLTGAPLAYEGENGYIFTAPAGSSKIYAGTTMLNNELIYNQLINNKTKADAKAYVHAKFVGGDPSTQNKADIAEAIKANIAAHPNKSRYAVIAALMNKIMVSALTAPNNIKNIRVTAQDITAANTPSLAKLDVTKSFSKSNDAEIANQNTLGWVDAKDSEVISITAKNGKIVAGSKYHNGLTVINESTKSKVFTPVSIITDSGHNIDSASGASETYLKDVELSSDAKFVYVNIPPKKSTSTTYDAETMGLYKVKLENNGSIATNTENLVGTGQRVSIDLTNSKRLNKIVGMFAVSSDDSKVLVYDSEKNLFIYDSDLKNQIAAVETDGLDAIAISGNSVFVAIDDNIIKKSLTDLSDTGKIELGFNAKGIVVSADGTQLLAYNDETQLALVNLANNSVNNSSVLYEADSVSISDDFTKVALAGEHEKSILVINLTVPGFSIQGRYDAVSETVAFLGNDRLAIGNGTGVTVLKVATTTINNSLTSKITSSKDGMNYSSINNGNYLNSVVKDMNLPSRYENINIAWAKSGLSSNLSLPDGAVTRPAENSADATGSLTATLSGSFRGEQVTSTETFNLTIKKLAPISNVTSALALTKTFRGGFMSAGANGKVASLNRDGNEGGIFILDSNATTLSFYVGDMDDSDGATYHKFGEEEDGIAVAYTKADQVVAVTNNGNIYRYTITGANAITESQKITLIDTNIHSATFNNAKTKLAILVSDAGGNYKTKIYNINANGAVAYGNAVAMEKLVYDTSRGELAINDDASVIYARSEGEVINAQAGTAHTSFTIDERMAGVWYIGNTTYATTRTGKIFSFPNGNLANANTRVDTGHNGRIYTLAEAGGKLFAFLYAKNTDDGGVSILDKNTLEELRFLPSKTAYKGTISEDGKSVYTFSYSKPRKLTYIHLP